MTLIDYAKKELSLISNSDDPMQSLMNQNILDLITEFSKQGHSGFSASYLTNTLNRLMQFKPLTPLTGEDDEWNEVTDGVWQNNRYSSVFKVTNGTAYDNGAFIKTDDDGNTYWSSGGRREYITFPYTPPNEPKVIDETPNKEFSFVDVLPRLINGERFKRSNWAGDELYIKYEDNLIVDDLKVTPFFMIKTASEGYSVFNPSSCDVLATDWLLVKESDDND